MFDPCSFRDPLSKSQWETLRLQIGACSDEAEQAAKEMTREALETGKMGKPPAVLREFHSRLCSALAPLDRKSLIEELSYAFATLLSPPPKSSIDDCQDPLFDTACFFYHLGLPCLAQLFLQQFTMLSLCPENDRPVCSWLLPFCAEFQVRLSDEAGDLACLRQASALMDSAAAACSFIDPFLQPALFCHDALLTMDSTVEARVSYSAFFRRYIFKCRYDTEQTSLLLPKAYSLWKPSLPQSDSPQGCQERALLTLLEGDLLYVKDTDEKCLVKYQDAMRQMEPLMAQAPTLEFQRAFVHCCQRICFVSLDIDSKSDPAVLRLEDAVGRIKEIYAQTNEYSDLSLLYKSLTTLSLVYGYADDLDGAHVPLDECSTFWQARLTAAKNDEEADLYSIFYALSSLQDRHARLFVQQKKYEQARDALRASCDFWEQNIALIPLDPSRKEELADRLRVLGCLPPRDLAALRRARTLYKEGYNSRKKKFVTSLLIRFPKVNWLANFFVASF